MHIIKGGTMHSTHTHLGYSRRGAPGSSRQEESPRPGPASPDQQLAHQQLVRQDGQRAVRHRPDQVDGQAAVKAPEALGVPHVFDGVPDAWWVERLGMVAHDLQARAHHFVRVGDHAGDHLGRRRTGEDR